MDLYEVIEKRRTVRNFSNKKVENEKIIKALEAGIKAPTYNHLREWDFILVNDENIRLQIVQAEGISDNFNIAELETGFANVDTVAKGMYLDAIPKQKSMLIKAPGLLVVVFKPKTRIDKAKTVYDVNCLASVWCCIENILLSFTEQNIYGVTYIPQKSEEVKKVLSIPDEMELAALIPFGYKDENSKILPQKKINLSEKLHFEKW